MPLAWFSISPENASGMSGLAGKLSTRLAGRSVSWRRRRRLRRFGLPVLHGRGGQPGTGPRRLARFEQGRDHRADFCGLALFELDLVEHAVIERLEHHVGLVGLDLGKLVAMMDLITRMLEPPQNLALLHGVGELRHRDLAAHSLPTKGLARCALHHPFGDSDDLAGARQRRLFKMLVVWNRLVEGCDALDRRIEMIES